MKPFSREMLSLYLSSGPVWEWTRESPGETLGEAVKLAWKKAFGEELDVLPEPFDLLAGDFLYIFPKHRYLMVSAPDAPNPGAEIREAMPLYFVVSQERCISSFNAKGRMEALDRLRNEVLLTLPAKREWSLFERFQPGAEPQLVLKGDS